MWFEICNVHRTSVFKYRGCRMDLWSEIERLKSNWDVKITFFSWFFSNPPMPARRRQIVTPNRTHQLMLMCLMHRLPLASPCYTCYPYRSITLHIMWHMNPTILCTVKVCWCVIPVSNWTDLWKNCNFKNLFVGKLILVH